MEKILLEYRKDTGDWGIPGGYMEPGETLKETAIRELKEELSTSADDLSLYDVFSEEDFYHVYPNGDQVYSVMALYFAESINGDINPDQKEIGKVTFFEKEAIPEKLTKTTQVILKKVVLD
ncbi:NUDIX domain-containing protein [Bacillus marinisedimentorum]|uniref:NUDIX domain-containing protein n=1 Tax=Bacillus marinisedimentorum TaxID=1821260 RepID=UPI0009F538F4|nr:NUDIX domain-containing protein [Bacillus marinisedimentorum]